MKRKKLSPQKSKNLFRATASNAHIKNSPHLKPMRGGTGLQMPCTKPIKAWKYGVHDSGKQKLVFKDPRDSSAEIQMVPCGKCISCKLDYAREWATRITHESQTAKISCFPVTIEQGG